MQRLAIPVASQGGKSGLWISDLSPDVRQHADQLCLIKSMQTDIPAHPPAFVQMHTGISTSPRPSMAAWVLYGLGTENANLPGFVTIAAPACVRGRQAASGTDPWAAKRPGRSRGACGTPRPVPFL